MGRPFIIATITSYMALGGAGAAGVKGGVIGVHTY